jgi:hypothetical protein
MPLAITRQVKTGGTLVDADGVTANTNPSKITVIRKMNSVIVPIPGEQHFGLPIGPEANEFTAEWVWDMTNPPCAGTLYRNSLKQWTGNSIYSIVASGSLTNDIATGKYLLKSLTHERKAPGVRGAPGGTFQPVWKVKGNFIKLRDTDVTDCPNFTDVTVSNSYSGADPTPYFKMTSTLDATSITTKLSSIKVTHTGSVQAFALYDEEAITILPPLGSVGPVIDIEFRIANNTDFGTVKSWAASRSTVVGVDQRHYNEFDIDNPTTYYSKWIVGNINWDRDPTSGADYARLSTNVNRKITMSLTRYWGYELIEV